MHGTLPLALLALLPLAGINAECPYVIVGTGQTKCYDSRNEILPPKPGQPFYGHDAQYRNPEPSYTLSADGLTVHDNTDGTITDRATGLIWAKADSGKGMNWQDALAWVQGRNAEKYLGHDDWRMPSVKELQSIVVRDNTGTARLSGSGVKESGGRQVSVDYASVIQRVGER